MTDDHTGSSCRQKRKKQMIQKEERKKKDINVTIELMKRMRL